MVNVEFGNEGWKNEMISMIGAWDNEKIWVPDRNQTRDLPNTSQPCTLSTELQELMESKAIKLSSYEPA